MDKQSLAGVIIMALCCALCGFTFLGIGMWAENATKPVNFWSGTTVEPEKVRDLRGYNHANAVMWKLYSIPFWIAFALGCLGCLDRIFMIAGAILLSVACVPGLVFLIWRYRVIEKTYVKP